MNFASKHRQTAVYWPPNGNTGGKPVFGVAQEIAPGTSTGGVRFESDFMTKLNATGEIDDPVAVFWYDADAVTFEKDGRIFAGALTDLTAGEILDPTIVENIGAIMELQLTPNLRATQTLGKALCNGG